MCIFCSLLSHWTLTLLQLHQWKTLSWGTSLIQCKNYRYVSLLSSSYDVMSGPTGRWRTWRGDWRIRTRAKLKKAPLEILIDTMNFAVPRNITPVTLSSYTSWLPRVCDRCLHIYDSGYQQGSWRAKWNYMYDVKFGEPEIVVCALSKSIDGFGNYRFCTSYKPSSPF